MIPYYARFLARCPTVADLAAAPHDDVMALWAGLGYYTRARNLHAAAKKVVTDFGGVFPQTPEEIASLPGVGRSTAAAIAAFSFNTRSAILDGNVKRVLARWAGIDGNVASKAIETRMWDLAQSLLPASQDMPAYTQAIMDLGATVCTPKKPACLTCPMQEDCVARREGRQLELPAPKPKKKIPERQTVMLMVQDGDRILLEQRPPTGIWGGLWSLPETGSTLDAEADFAARFGLAIALEPALPEFVHVFTHFRLTITPQPARVTGAVALRSDQTRWFTRQEALAAGIPTPLRKLLLLPSV